MMSRKDAFLLLFVVSSLWLQWSRDDDVAESSRVLPVTKEGTYSLQWSRDDDVAERVTGPTTEPVTLSASMEPRR